MVFKSIPLTFYPTSLKYNYTAKVTDYRQSAVSSPADSAIIYIYDIKKTPIINKNPIKVIMTRNNSNGETIRGYKIISNDKTTKKALSAASSYTLEHSNLRDGKESSAEVIFYGGGTGVIKKTNNSRTFNVRGKSLSAGVTFTINKTSFNYPTNSEIVTVTPTYSGTNVEPTNQWIVNWTAIVSNGVEIVGISGSEKNSGSGSVTFKRTYDKETTGTPTVEIVLNRLEADWSFSESGSTVKYAIVKDGGASGYENPDGTGTQYWVPGGTEVEITDDTYTPEHGGMYCFTWVASWGEYVSAWVFSDNVRFEDRAEGTEDFHSGTIKYKRGEGEWWIEINQ